MFTNKELYDLIELYFKAHKFDTLLLICRACGIRNFQSENDTTSINCKKVSLQSLRKVCKMTIYQKKNLDD